MKKDSNPEKKRLVPDGENRCVWMTAGIVDFKLCDFGFDCENCPFEAAIRSGQSYPPKYYSQTVADENIDGKEVIPLTLPEILEQFPPLSLKINEGIYYHPKFTWIKQINPRLVQVGIDPFLLQMLGNLHSIVTPVIGSQIHTGEYLCWLFGDYPPLPIQSPLDGVVTSFNKDVREEPEMLIAFNELHVWLLQVKPDYLLNALKDLKINESAIEWRNNQIKLLKKMLNSALTTKQNKTGATLNDGGTRLNRIVDILGKQKYYEVIYQFLKKS